MTASTKALAAEQAAFNHMQKALHPFATVLIKPAGFEASFPDFAFRLHIGGRLVDIHVEYKADKTAQMGSMRDWVFDGYRFTATTPDPEKEQLLDIMNNDRDAIENGRRLLKDFQEYADPSIKSIHSGMMGFESDMAVRKAKLRNFATKTRDFQLKKIQGVTIGSKIEDHYLKKFKKAIKRDADLSLLLFYIKDTVYFVESIGDVKLLADAGKILGNPSIRKMGNLQAKLEVRIQPRGLNSPSPGRVDTIASMRLIGAPSNGWKL